MERVTKRRDWQLLGALPGSDDAHPMTEHSQHGAADSTFDQTNIYVNLRLLAGVACALLALLLASLLRFFAGLSLLRCVTVVGGASLCLLVGAAMHGLLTQRRAALRARAELQRLVVTRPAALIALVQPAGHICYASPSFKTILGCEPALLVDTLAVEHVHPADSDEVTTHFARIRSSGIDQARFRLRHADGSWRWIATYGARTQHLGQAALILVGHHITEDTQHTTDSVSAPSHASISRLIGAVSHDASNLLTAIAGIAALGVQAHDHELGADLASIGHAADRAATLIGHLRTFTQPRRFAPRLIDLNALLHQLTHFVERLLGPEISISMNLAPSLTAIWGDPIQLEQVILNVMLNARDAMSGRGRLRIATTAIAHDPGRAAARVRLTISDTGVGMDAATRARMFEPYFTTKAPHHGTGLGLATCAEIIKQHRGCIQVESAPGCGTTLTIDLPCAHSDRGGVDRTCLPEA